MAGVSRDARATKHTWPFVYAAVLFGMLGWLHLISQDDRGYRRLAESFLQGKLFFVSMPPNTWGDGAFFEGRHYSVLDPFPAVLAMSLVWIGHYHQGLLSFVITIAVFYLCFKRAG